MSELNVKPVYDQNPFNSKPTYKLPVGLIGCVNNCHPYSKIKSHVGSLGTLKVTSLNLLALLVRSIFMLMLLQQT